MSIKSFHSNLSLSSESLNISEKHSNRSLFSNKEESLQLCIDEVQLINKTLNHKSEQLKQWQNALECKEKDVIQLANSANQYLDYKVASKSFKAIFDAQERYSHLDKKFNKLFKDYKRLLSSFESIKLQNKSLKSKIEEFQAKEEILNQEKEKLIAKIAIIPTKMASKSSVKLRDVTTQTRVVTDDDKVSCCSHEKRLDPTLSFTTILHQVWLQLFHTSMQNMFTVNPHHSNPSNQSFAEICLLVIPISIEYFRTNILTTSDVVIQTCLHNRYLEVLRHYVDMLYWSVVYLDICRIPLRLGVMSSLTRLGEDLALIIVSKTSSSSSLKTILISDDYLLSKVLLLLVRCVNQMDLLSLVVNYLHDLVKKKQGLWGTYLSNCLYVPLLCRWTSTSTCYYTIHSKIFFIVFESLCQNIDHDVLQYSPSFITDNKQTGLGLEQLVSIIITIPLHVSETNKTTTYHPLGFILDTFHTSRPSERDVILGIIDQVIQTKQVRLLSRELGIIGIISSLICSLSAQCSDSQSYARFISKLKSTLNCANT